MKFLQATGLLPTADELAPLTDDQNLAILESLFLTVIVDGKVDPNEVKAFAVSALTYPWNWGQSTEVVKTKLDAIGGSLGGVTRETMKAHLQGLGARIPTPVLREKTFAGMFALMIADGKLDEKEKTAAIAFAQVFEIPHTRAVEIIQTVLNALLAAAKK
ncbi:MAG: hypothetical protein KF773_40950 [Deltaproteobacteria bacterium]|nr:hypothetical protein [Deltaproteobacteria bacterium]